MKTAEDIFNKHCTLVTKDWHEYIILSKEKFIAEIEAYASERTRDELIVLSEEAIEHVAYKFVNKQPKFVQDVHGTGEYTGFIHGAKWAIDQIKNQ
jgi:hypothetical protein